jgi:hypothetical protein
MVGVSGVDGSFVERLYVARSYGVRGRAAALREGWTEDAIRDFRLAQRLLRRLVRRLIELQDFYDHFTDRASIDRLFDGRALPNFAGRGSAHGGGEAQQPVVDGLRIARKSSDSAGRTVIRRQTGMHRSRVAGPLQAGGRRLETGWLHGTSTAACARWCCPNPSTAGERPSGRRVAHLRQARREGTMTVP